MKLKNIKRLMGPALLAATLYFPLKLQAEVIDMSTTFIKAITSSCKSMAPSLINDPNFAVITKTAPIEIDKVCMCTEAVLINDHRIRKFLKAEQQVLAQRMKSPELQAYATVRFTGALFSCIAPELDASLEKSKLLQ